MDKNRDTSENCRSFFKDGGTQTSTKDYTNAWISLINQLERHKGGTAGAEK